MRAQAAGAWEARLRSRTAQPYAVAALIAVMFMGSTIVTPLYALYRDQFQFSKLTLTLIYSVYVLGNLAALLFLGRLSDRFGRRRVSGPAMALAGLATLAFLFASHTAGLFVGRILSGFAIGLASGTATAWLAELDPDRNRARAALIATSANFTGLAIGPLLAGLLAQYAPSPLVLPYLIYLVVLAAVAWAVHGTRETVTTTAARSSLEDHPWRPRLGVPKGIRVRFASPAATVFSTMALVGFYAALLPTLLAEELHETSLAAAGAIVAWMFVVAVVAIIVTRNVGGRRAMLAGLVLLLPGVTLLVTAEMLRSMPILMIGTTVAGVAAALGYRGSLQVVNELAPDDRRAEVVSSYFICGFVGNSVPIIGIGIIATYMGSLVASISFASTIAIFAVAGLVIATRATARAGG